MKILLVGLSHRTTPVKVREMFAVSDPGPILSKLVSHDEIEEVVLISTCNRVEMVVTTRRRDAALHRVRDFFSRELTGGVPLPDGHKIEDFLYEHEGAEATLHLFRVAASIDSMVVGEPQILGQVKQAYQAALEAKTCQALMNRLFHRAFEAAKCVRRETRIAERPVSVARVAVELAQKIFESFEDKSALLIGAGEMTDMALDVLRGRGLTSLRVANRTVARAEEVAQRFGAEAYGLDEIPRLFSEADVVLTCIGGEEPVLHEELLKNELKKRSRRPVFIIDLGVPRNVDPNLNEYEGVYLYDIDDLTDVAEMNSERRRQQTKRAEAIVVREQQRFEGWFSALEAVPTIRDLRDRAEAIRRSELEKVVGRLDLNDDQHEGVEALTRSILNKILHEPVSRLRHEANSEQSLGDLEVARKLFGLDKEEEIDVPLKSSSSSESVDE